MKQILAAIQFWEGDMERAMELARVMSALPEGAEAASVLLIGRRDLGWVEQLPLVVKAKALLEEAGYEVHLWRSGRRGVGFHRYKDGTICAAGPNDLWHETVNHAWDLQQQGKIDVAGTLTLEGDDWPLERDWLQRLARDFQVQRKSVYGHLVRHQELDRMSHINGNAIFAIDLPRRYDVLGCPDHWAWDVYHAPKWLASDSYDSPLILSDYKGRDLPSELIYRPKVAGTTPVMHHGCQDDSAKFAARERLGVDYEALKIPLVIPARLLQVTAG